MGFKITFIVLCLVISYCLVEGLKNEKHEKRDKHKSHHTIKHKEHNKHKKDKGHKNTEITHQDRLVPIRLTRKASTRAIDGEIAVEEAGGFNFDFSKIPGGAGVKIIFDGLRNIFMSINRVLNFGFIWDGISGIIALFRIDTGATFVINAVTKMGGFVGYMLRDVTNAIKSVASGAQMIVGSAFELIQSVVRFALNNVGNLVVNIATLVKALIGVTTENLRDILGPIYDLVYTGFKVLFDAVGQVANSVGKGLMVIFEPILGAIRSVTRPIVNILSTVLRQAGGIFDGSVFQAIAQGLGGVVRNVVGGVVGGIKTIAGGVFGAVSVFVNGIGGAVNSVGTAIGSVFGRYDNDTVTGYTNIDTTTIRDENPIKLEYGNVTDEFFQHFIREGEKSADLIILYKGGKDNFIAFYNKKTEAVFILSGNTGNIFILDTKNGAGIFFKPNSTTGYAIQPPGFLRADFDGPTPQNVSDALIKLSHAIDELSVDLDKTVDVVTLDIIEVLRTVKAKNLLSSVLTGEALVVVSRLLGHLLRNLAAGLPPIIRPALGVANTLIPFLLNLPENLINGIISLIGTVVKRFLGLFAPEFVTDLAKMVVIAALKGLTTPLLATLLTPLGAISTTVSVALFAAQTALDLLHLP